MKFIFLFLLLIPFNAMAIGPSVVGSNGIQPKGIADKDNHGLSKHDSGWREISLNDLGYGFSGGTITIDAADFKHFMYKIENDTCFIKFDIQDLSLSASGVYIYIDVPPKCYVAFRTSPTFIDFMPAYDNGAFHAAGARIIMYNNDSKLYMYLNDGTWAASTNATSIRASIMIPIKRVK